MAEAPGAEDSIPLTLFDHFKGALAIPERALAHLNPFPGEWLAEEGGHIVRRLLAAMVNVHDRAAERGGDHADRAPVPQHAR